VIELECTPDALLRSKRTKIGVAIVLNALVEIVAVSDKSFKCIQFFIPGKDKSTCTLSNLSFRSFHSYKS
jgi:hypothetical protein